MSRNTKLDLKCVFTAMAIAFCVFILFSYLLHLQNQKLEVDETLESSIYGNLLWTEVDRELNSLLFISNGMASFISAYKDDLQPEKIKFILKDLW